MRNWNRGIRRALALLLCVVLSFSGRVPAVQAAGRELVKVDNIRSVTVTESDDQSGAYITDLSHYSYKKSGDVEAIWSPATDMYRFCLPIGKIGKAGTYTFKKPVSIRYENAGYTTEGVPFDLEITLTSLKVYCKEQQAGYSHLEFLGIAKDGSVESIAMVATSVEDNVRPTKKELNGGYPGVEAVYSMKLIPEGKISGQPVIMLRFDDVDRPDVTDFKAGSRYEGTYAESVRLIDGFGGKAYVQKDCVLDVSEGLDLFRAAVATTGQDAWRKSAFAVFIYGLEGTFAWTGSNCAAFVVGSTSVVNYPNWEGPDKTVDKSVASPGEKLTYTVSQTFPYVVPTNAAGGICVTDTLDPALDPLTARWQVLDGENKDRTGEWTVNADGPAITFTAKNAAEVCGDYRFLISADLRQDTFSGGTMEQTPDGGTVIRVMNAAHTIVNDVDIASQPVRTDVPGEPAVSLTKHVDREVIKGAKAGDEVTYTFEVVNTGNLPLSGVKIEDALAISGFAFDWEKSSDGASGEGCLSVGERVSASARYALTQDDIDAAEVINKATAFGTDPAGTIVSAEAKAETAIEVSPAITLVKSVEQTALVDPSAGDKLTYHFLVANTGDVTLTELALSDDLDITGLTWERPFERLLPGEEMKGTAVYALTQADIDAGKVVNKAAVSGRAPSGEKVQAEDDAETVLTGTPGITLVKTTPEPILTGARAGDKVTFDFLITNTGNVTLTATELTDALEEISRPSVQWPEDDAAGRLLPGESVKASALYTLTQADIDAGEVLNKAFVTAKAPDGSSVSDEDTAAVTLTEAPEIELIKTVSGVRKADGTPAETGRKAESAGAEDAQNGPEATDVREDSGNASDESETAGASKVAGEREAAGAGNTAGEREADRAGEAAGEREADRAGEAAGEREEADETGISGAGDAEAAGENGANDTGKAETADVSGMNGAGHAKVASESGASGADEAQNLSESVVSSEDGAEATAQSRTSGAGEAKTSGDCGTSGMDEAESVAAVEESAAGEPQSGIGKWAEKIFFGPQLVGILSGHPFAMTGAETESEGHDVEASALERESGTTTAENAADDNGGATGDELSAAAEEDTALVTLSDGTVIRDARPGDVISYAFAVTNTGNVTLNNVSIEDFLAGIGPLTYDWSGASVGEGVLLPGETITAWADYSVTQADINKGRVDNQAVASGLSPKGTKVEDDGEAGTGLEQRPAFTVVKSVDRERIDKAKCGDVLIYTLAMANTGNVTLYNCFFEDELEGLGEIVYASEDHTLVPGQSLTATAAYAITQADIDRGYVKNAVLGRADGPDGRPLDPGRDEVVTELPADPAIMVTKVPDKTVIRGAVPGDTINYSFTGTNTGNVTLRNVALTDELEGLTGLSVDWSGASEGEGVLLPGESLTAKATYALTQADIDLGEVLNHVVISGTAPADEETGEGRTVTDEDDSVTELPREGGIEVTKAADKVKIDGARAGDQISYRIVGKNTSNVTLYAVTLKDELKGLEGLTLDWKGASLGEGTLLPGEVVTAAASYKLTQKDIDAGAVTNTVVITGTTGERKDGTTETLTDEDEVSTLLLADAAIKVEKKADKTKLERAKAGDLVNYTIKVTNTGLVTLSKLQLEDSLEGLDPLTYDWAKASLGEGILLPGESVTATGPYKLTQKDIDSGAVRNVAVAKAETPDGSEVTGRDEVRTVIRLKPAISLTKTVDKKVILNAVSGNELRYGFVITNTGDTTLSSVSVRDELPGLAQLTFDWNASSDPSTDAGVLSPGETVTCFAVYKITGDDIEHGKVVNTAEAGGSTASGDRIKSASVSVTTILRAPAGTPSSPSYRSSQGGSGKASPVKTGDASRPLMYLLIMAGCAAAAVVVFKRRRMK